MKLICIWSENLEYIINIWINIVRQYSCILFACFIQDNYCLLFLFCNTSNHAYVTMIVTFMYYVQQIKLNIWLVGCTCYCILHWYWLDIILFRYLNMTTLMNAAMLIHTHVLCVRLHDWWWHVAICRRHFEIFPPAYYLTLSNLDNFVVWKVEFQNWLIIIQLEFKNCRQCVLQ